ncbi:MAG: hypothetical protein AAB225_21750 [Acidobacteriota bacterium]
MTDLYQYLEGLMNQVCTDLARMYPSEQQPSEYGLVFPSKRDGTVRISEQEAKLLFVQHLTVGRRYCFSVETPTAETYQQKGKTPISARVDLTLFGADRKPVAHIELKAHNCKVEAIRKDLEKLLRESTTGMWFHTLRRADGRTLDTLIRKFKSAFSLLPECLRTNDRSYLVAFFVLEDARLHWQWLHLSGDDDQNREAVAAMFEEDVHRSRWTTAKFRDSNAGQDSKSTSRAEQGTATGKGSREAFFVFIPTLAPHTFLHLSVRGGSYRLRQYDLRTTRDRPRVFTVPSCSSLDALRASNIIAEWVPVTAEDLCHSIDEEPQYWCERIRAVNSAHLPVPNTT